MEVEHAPRGFPYNSAKTLLRKSEDMDYNDVFGGPPRRFSMQELRGRSGFLETAIGEVEVEDEEDRASTPVFGEETTPRRRNTGSNFFDDIFGGDESYASPRNRDRDRNNLFGTSPNSTFVSPTKPKSEQFGTSSLPAHFSLPAKLNKVELPPFASLNQSSYKINISTNALISPRSSTTLSRFSSQVVRSQDEVKNEARLYRQSTLPREACFRFEDSPNTATSDEKEVSPNSNKNRKSFDGFSIYKWASGRAIPMMNLMGRNSSRKSKDRIERCASFNERAESRPSITRMEDFSAHKEPVNAKMESEKIDSGSKDEEKEPLGAEVVTSGAIGSIKPKRRMSRAEIRIMEKFVREVSLKDESLESEVMPTLRSLLIAEAEQQDNKITTPCKDQPESSKSSNKIESIEIHEDSNANPEAGPGKRVAAEKVKGFVEFFNQEPNWKRKGDVHVGSGSHRWKATGTDQKENVCLNTEKADDCLEKDEMRSSEEKKITTDESDNLSNNPSAASSLESILRYSTTSVDNSYESLEDNFRVAQLSGDIEEATQGSEGLDTINAIDAKIEQWSLGKTGNIRSLLSTLQYVLWPGSGWNPIPLVELIEPNSVKRAYQKALLRLHPDKLQQSSADSHHKYTAEKIFDILQEAWDHFNTLASL
ncbi:J domain-containing protein required for chloroplast accumulation response 1-like isoform X2 [Andrographis paniculata]|uniref:J domain-containing protein required for chloroplast accumulation response 1-like isoform X2 n=1 Tax=Andrographis paniculata TaxID=175694 RepID=UPI0021E7DA7A|nr:J domain-containing protein required for chloroplast accumulation response 1-like isoform X2 [Andrographis paniculata]